jgi:hypothetical protein
MASTVTTKQWARQTPIAYSDAHSSAALISGNQFGEIHERLIAQGYLEYRPKLAEICGGFKPALMLGHALYWTRNWLRTQHKREGWFWKTALEWQNATGLSTREQESAREALRGSGIWEEKLTGGPAKLHFRIDLDALTVKLGLSPTGDLSEANRFHQLSQLLEVPTMYFRPLADIGGSVATGLVLSHLLSQYKSAARNNELGESGFFPTNIEDARVNLGLGSKVQRNARESLRKAGFIQEDWAKAQRPQLVTRLNLQAILSCLCGQTEPRSLKRPSRTAKLAQMAAVQVQPSLLERSNQIMGRHGPVSRVVRLLELGGESVKSHSRVTRLIEKAGVAGDGVDDGASARLRVALLSKLYTKGIYKYNNNCA